MSNHYRAPLWLATVLVLVTLVIVPAAGATTLAYAEYFIDTDPGQGAATSLLPCDGSFDSDEEEFCLDAIASPSLAVGRHTLFLRLKDSDNRWFIRRTDFFVKTKLAEAEYFFDVDPGQGAGISLLPCDGAFDEVEEEFCLENISVPDLPAGRHILFLRLIDGDGNVTVRQSPFFITSPLAYAEYFIDSDPGQGNAISINPEDGTFDSTEESFLVSGISSDALTPGQHKLYMRLRDQDGRWSERVTSFFVSSANPYEPNTVAAAEYSIDGGFWQPLDASDGFFDEAEEWMSSEIASVLDTGVHVVSVRAQDNFGAWGFTRSQSFRVRESNPHRSLTAAEFFIDSDPGQGNGTPLVAGDSAFDSSQETATLDSIDTDSYNSGAHTVYVRFRDNGVDTLGYTGWGPIASALLEITEELPYICGDADGDREFTIADAVYLINYIFAGGLPPNPLLAGDTDCSSDINIADAVVLINYIFAGGPLPCAGCGD